MANILLEGCLTSRPSPTQAIRRSQVEHRRVVLPVPEAPTFYPTPEQFSNLLAYVATLREAGEKYGIVRVVPPQGYRPDFSLNVSARFPTKVQNLHELQEGQPFDEVRTSVLT